MCIAVSEEIDPIDTDAAFWSLAYRFDPGAPGKNLAGSREWLVAARAEAACRVGE